MEKFIKEKSMQESPLITKSKKLSEYWLELLIESGYYDKKDILELCLEVKRLLISTLNTAKQNK